jgi:hypothetical protein
VAQLEVRRYRPHFIAKTRVGSDARGSAGGFGGVKANAPTGARGAFRVPTAGTTGRPWLVGDPAQILNTGLGQAASRGRRKRSHIPGCARAHSPTSRGYPPQGQPVGTADGVPGPNAYASSLVRAVATASAEAHPRHPALDE